MLRYGKEPALNVILVPIIKFFLEKFRISLNEFDSASEPYLCQFIVFGRH